MHGYILLAITWHVMYFASKYLKNKGHSLSSVHNSLSSKICPPTHPPSSQRTVSLTRSNFIFIVIKEICKLTDVFNPFYTQQISIEIMKDFFCLYQIKETSDENVPEK